MVTTLQEKVVKEKIEAKVGVDRVRKRKKQRQEYKQTVQKIEIHDQRKAHIIKAHRLTHQAQSLNQKY